MRRTFGTELVWCPLHSIKLSCFTQTRLDTNLYCVYFLSVWPMSTLSDPSKVLLSWFPYMMLSSSMMQNNQLNRNLDRRGVSNILLLSLWCFGEKCKISGNSTFYNNNNLFYNKYVCKYVAYMWLQHRNS